MLNTLYSCFYHALLTAETPPIMKSTVEKKTSTGEKGEEGDGRTGKVLGGLDPLDVF
jgi:hypothetical protein